MLDNIRIVLVNTSHPGNIGSAARAMKTMGLTKLYLVSPQAFPHPKANEMAAGSTDILENVIIVKSLDEAIADCALVIGTSARQRSLPWPCVPPRKMAEQAAAVSTHHPVAILFGREQTGLTNEELECCHLQVEIPANPSYSSLNIAAAVQVIAYELRLISLTEVNYPVSDYRPATMQEMEKFFTHLEKVLVEIDFLKLSAPRRLMTRLRRLFLRATPDVMEVNMLRGMLTAVQEIKNKPRI